MRREQQHLQYELERELDRRIEEEDETMKEPMQLFGEWLERYEATHGEHDGWYADLVDLWANEERGEQETLTLELEAD